MAEARRGGTGGLTASVVPYAGLFLQWFASKVGGIGGMILQFLLTVKSLSGVLYTQCEVAVEPRTRCCRKSDT